MFIDAKYEIDPELPIHPGLIFGYFLFVNFNDDQYDEYLKAYIEFVNVYDSNKVTKIGEKDQANESEDKYLRLVKNWILPKLSHSFPFNKSNPTVKLKKLVIVLRFPF